MDKVKFPDLQPLAEKKLSLFDCTCSHQQPYLLSCYLLTSSRGRTGVLNAALAHNCAHSDFLLAFSVILCKLFLTKMIVLAVNIFFIFFFYTFVLLEAHPLHMPIIRNLLSHVAYKAKEKIMLIDCYFACFYIVVGSSGPFLSANHFLWCRAKWGCERRRRGSGRGAEEEPVHPAECPGQQPAELQQHNSWQGQDLQVGDTARVCAC